MAPLAPTLATPMPPAPIAISQEKHIKSENRRLLVLALILATS